MIIGAGLWSLASIYPTPKLAIIKRASAIKKKIHCFFSFTNSIVSFTLSIIDIHCVFYYTIRVSVLIEN